MVTIWSFADAPREYQAMSTHGGDEDLVALYEGNNADLLPWQLGNLFNMSWSRNGNEYEAHDYDEHWGHIQRVALPGRKILAICAHA
jgi:hypothetical protein